MPNTLSFTSIEKNLINRGLHKLITEAENHQKALSDIPEYKLPDQNRSILFNFYANRKKECDMLIKKINE